MLHFLNNQLSFPPVSAADEDGLLAVGGDLRPERLLLAYRSGIFPWFNEEDPLLWWSPDPRFVLFPDKLIVSKSMKAVLRKNVFDFKINTDFEGVIKGCADTPRGYADGTWITPEMQDAYMELHRRGCAHSAECWQQNELVGGLYGVRIGTVFFGESMFSRVSNASKAAFILYVQQLQSEGVQLIDCQMHTAHLESLGAEAVSRDFFMESLRQNIG